MMRKFWTASVAAMAFALTAVPASAQAPWSVSGELADDDRVDGEHRYDDHAIRLEAGQRYRLSVDSDAFDPVARLYRQGSDSLVAENDDAGGTLNSRINYRPDESGDYVLRVRSYSVEGRGAYTAGVTALPPLPPAASLPWSVNGRIEDGDSADGDSRYDEHVLRLEAGRRYVLTVDSTAFDPVARLYRAGEDEVIAEDDDGGGEFNARISFLPSESGDYVLRVVPFGAEGRGDYRAAAAPAPPLPAPLTAHTGMQTMVWRVYAGDLADADGEGPHGARVDDYLVRFEAGQTRLIALDATDFDPVVQVLRTGEREAGEPLAANDDNGGSLNSLLEFKAEEAGDYIVRVTAFGSDGRGRYRLRISD